MLPTRALAPMPSCDYFASVFSVFGVFSTFSFFGTSFILSSFFSIFGSDFLVFLLGLDFFFGASSFTSSFTSAGMPSSFVASFS